MRNTDERRFFLKQKQPATTRRAAGNAENGRRIRNHAIMNKLFFTASLAILLPLAISAAAACAAPFPVAGWQLQENDELRINRMIDLAAENGVNHLQLSHSIIMDIDELAEDGERAAMIRRVAIRAKEKGIGVFVWSHEFNTDEMTVCLDPETRKGKAAGGLPQSAVESAGTRGRDTLVRQLASRPVGSFLHMRLVRETRQRGPRGADTGKNRQGC